MHLKGSLKMLVVGKGRRSTSTSTSTTAVAMASKEAIAIFFFLALSFLSVATEAEHSGIVFSKVDRKFDLTSQVVRCVTTIKVENTGPSAVSEILYSIPSKYAEALAFLRVSTSEGKGKSKAAAVPLNVNPVEVSGAPDGAISFSVSLLKPLGSGESVSIDLYQAFTNLLKPFPVEISQSDVQLVLYHESAYLFSPYPTKMQSTIFRTPTSRIESYTKVDPVKVIDTEVRYGPFENIPPFSILPITVHFENNRPFALVEELVREIEISNWGNIYVKEDYRLVHNGARHKGSFSRLDYQSKPMSSGVASFRHLLARLPPKAHSVYYRDDIGNISTSHLRSDSKKTDLELEPRYPLFGGWRTTFTIGYGIPLQDFVFATPDGKRYLQYMFGCPITDAVVEKLTLKVVLPEGSTDASVNSPFPVEEHKEVKYSYLDTFGRTVVVLTKWNVVQEHNSFFQVYFKFNKLAMLVEPSMLIMGFFIFFMTCIAYSRSDFSISKNSASYQARLQREEIQDAVQRIEKVMSTRNVVSEKLDSSLHDLARTGDIQACKAARKSADATLKETAKDLKNIYDSLLISARSSPVLPKVESLIQKEKEKQEKLLQKHSVAVESYERKLPSKEIDNRIAPHQQKLVALKLEVDDLMQALDDI